MSLKASPDYPGLGKAAQEIAKREAARDEPTIEHVLCGVCTVAPDVYICGTPRDVGNEALVTVGTPHTQTPCAVCFSAEVVTCNTCGTELRVRKA